MAGFQVVVIKRIQRLSLMFIRPSSLNVPGTGCETLHDADGRDQSLIASSGTNEVFRRDGEKDVIGKNSSTFKKCCEMLGEEEG